MKKIQEIIYSQIEEQREKLFLWVPFFVSLGIGLYFSLPKEPLFTLNLGIFLLFALLLLISYKFQDKTENYKLLFLFILSVFLIATGSCISQIRTHLAQTPLLHKKINITSVTGIIDSIEPLEQDEGSRVVLKSLNIEKLTPEQTPRKIRIKIRHDDGLHSGQKISVLASLNPTSEPIYPNAFDFQKHSYFLGIGAVGFSYKEPIILDTSASDYNTPIKNIREKLTTYIQNNSNEPQQSVLIALMTGTQSAIDDYNQNALRNSGLTHLLSISGMHIGMVAGVLFFVIRLFLALFPPLALRYPIKKWAAIVALIGTSLYALLVGAPIPTQRAIIMTGLVMLAIVFDRSPFSLRLIVLAGLAILLTSPESLMNVSFQMSFSAVIFLIYIFDKLQPLWKNFSSNAGIIQKTLLYILGICLTSIIAGFATGLFSLYHFQNFANYGVLANMIAVPITGFIIMPMIIACYFLIPLGFGYYPLHIAQEGVGWVLATAHWISKFDNSVLSIMAWPQWAFILFVLSGWIGIALNGKKRFFIMFFLTTIGIVGIVLDKPADIIISPKTELIALNTSDRGLSFSSGRKNGYIAEQWQKLYGEKDKEKYIWPKEGSTQTTPALDCDITACRTVYKNYKISFIRTHAALPEDCLWADIIISPEKIDKENCKASIKIDVIDSWKNQTHGIWLTDTPPKIRTVRHERGSRLWTTQN